jgi:CRISPR-associated protein Csm1
MDDTVYKIAIAGFLHDIGKFAERAGMEVSREYLDNNAALYQPLFQSMYTHKHAIYTAAFIEQYDALLPEAFNKGGWGLGDSFINLTAMHHKPETPLQWVIAIADRVSSGFERKEFENYNQEIKVKDYTKTRLLTLLEGISLNDNWKDDSLDSFQYRYPLRELSPENIFPSNTSEYRILDNKEARKEYGALFQAFTNSLKTLWHKENVPLWFEHFENLFMIYTSHIPAATVGNVIPDISLYDHSKTTAALAAAIYIYHMASNTLDTDHIRVDNDPKFLLVTGDLYGIQDFIFTAGGSTGRASAKLLRGRSFSVSLIAELAADMVCREFGVPASSIVLNAAGKFTIIAPNTDTARTKVQEIEETINKWLIENFYGESSLGISSIEATCNDFVSGNFPHLWEKLQSETDRKKFSKFNLSQYGGSVGEYLDSFNNTLEHPLCPFCGKRPSNENAFVNLSRSEKACACKVCHDHIYIGEHLVKEERIAITTPDADLKGEKLLEPIFSRYQLSFDVSGKLGDLARTGDLLKYWDIGIKKDGKISKVITAKFINGYVPRYEDSDNYDDRFLTGNKKDETKLELVESIKEGVPKSFLHIAKNALNFTDQQGKFKGIEALGILKADIDNLGLIFSYGIRQNRQTISRLATLSRQLNNFFAVYLPYVLSTDNNFKDIYTVFAGGDDLFLIGPWNRIIELLSRLNTTFKDYVCQNPDITLSAGMSINKPGEPIRSLAGQSEAALHQSKSSEKNRVTVFWETVEWDRFEKLDDIKNSIGQWLFDGTINNAMLYRFSDLIEMVKQEKEMKDLKLNIHMDDMECLKWRAKLKYSVVRNVGKKLKSGEKEKALEKVLKTVLWFEQYGGGMKIPLWQILYNNR